MQTVKQATVIALILMPLTLGLYLTFHPQEHTPLPRTTEKQTRPSEPGPVTDDPLLTLNAAFRTAYAAGRRETLRHAGPVILVEGDTVVLSHKGRRTELPFTPPIYHELKAVAHVPLAVYVLTAPFGDGPVSTARLDEMRRFRDLIPPVKARVEKLGFSAPVVERQHRILDDSTAFLDRLLEKKEVKVADVTAFTKGMTPLVMANVTEAARAQLDGLHARVMAWRKELPPEEWKQLRVMVMGSHMPREGNLVMQYFARLLGEAADDRRLMYAESMWDEKKVMDLLGTSMLDTGIGADFFGDDLRMHRDLLADAAAAYVKQLSFAP